MNAPDVQPVLRTGDLAYFDSLCGVIPCRVLSIRGESGPASSASTARIELTAARPGYPKGEELEVWTLHVVPRAAYFPRRYGARICYYTVEVSQ
jgi:hypothetical protein